MNTIEAIKTRKSVRTYLNRPVEDEKIKTVVEAGYMAAKTAMAGNVYFNVIRNPEVLKELADSTKTIMQKSGMKSLETLSSNPAYNPIYHAPVAVIISIDPVTDINMQAMAVACAACAGENMLLAATELGLGSCYLASPTMAFSIPAMRKAAKLTESVQPTAIIVFGYTNDTTPHAKRPENPDNILFVD